MPYFYNDRHGESVSTQVKTVSVPTEQDASIVTSVLCSSLFYWWFILLSDCRHLNEREIGRFPLGLWQMAEDVRSDLSALCSLLMEDLQRHAHRKDTVYQTTGRVVYDEYYPRHSKAIIDEIDRALARHYGFTAEELDYLINYDIKYRMGQESTDDA